MVVKILGNSDTTAYKEAERVVKSLGLAVWNETYFFVDVAIAPLLIEKVSNEELAEPNLGTLIFHPSPLPYGRGASSIRWAYRRQEPITAATWFWADSGLDTGDICEQEIVKIDYNLRPREFYDHSGYAKDIKTLFKRSTKRYQTASSTNREIRNFR